MARARRAGGAVSLLRKSPKLLDHAALWAAAHLKGDLLAQDGSDQLGEVQRER